MGGSTNHQGRGGWGGNTNHHCYRAGSTHQTLTHIHCPVTTTPAVAASSGKGRMGGGVLIIREGEDGGGVLIIIATGPAAPTRH